MGDDNHQNVKEDDSKVDRTASGEPGRSIEDTFEKNEGVKKVKLHLIT